MTRTLIQAAKKVLGTTRARVIPTMTNEIYALLTEAKRLHKKAVTLPKGREKNIAKEEARDAYHRFRLEHRRHLKLSSEEFIIQ